METVHYLNEEHIFLFLLQVFVLLGLARGLGEVFRRFNQPSITAEILVGVLVGPTILGRYVPAVYTYLFPADLIQQNMLETVAWFGILFFLLNSGLEMDFSSAWRQRGDAMKISITDVILPMIIAFVPCLFLSQKYMGDPDQRLLFCVFIATIMTISALPVTARVLGSLNLYKTELGFLIMCALSLNDILGWVIFTLVLGFVTQGSIELTTVVLILVMTIAFTLVCLTVGRRFTNHTIKVIHRKKLPEPGTSLTFVSLLGILCGAITVRIGIHALFGFFIAGMMAGEAAALPEKTRSVISQMVHAIFIPLFFAAIGLKIDFFQNFDLFLTAFIFIIGVGGRFLGAWIGTRFTKQSRANRYLIAIAHTPGGEMQIVVSILALEYGLITEPVFVSIIFGAVLSSMTLGPWMHQAIRKKREESVDRYFIIDESLIDLNVQNKYEAIEQMAAAISKHHPTLAVTDICDTLIRREKLLGTGIEEGVAIPHCRLAGLKEPVIAFARSSGGIDWNSPDGKATRFIFVVLCPEQQGEVLLNIFRCIAITMAQPGNRDRLMACTPQQIEHAIKQMFNLPAHQKA